LPYTRLALRSNGSKRLHDRLAVARCQHLVGHHEAIDHVERFVRLCGERDDLLGAIRVLDAAATTSAPLSTMP
jgi:hypothetical protein